MDSTQAEQFVGGFDPMQTKCKQPCRNHVIIGMLWVMWLVIFSLNYTAYFNDYSRYSDEPFMWGMSFKTFSLLAGLVTVILDAITLWGLLGNTPMLDRIPRGGRIAIVGIITGIGFAVIMYTHFVWTPEQLQDTSADPVLTTKGHRVLIYALILIIDIIMVMMQFSFDRNALAFKMTGGGWFSSDAGVGCGPEGATFGNIFGLLFGLGGVAADILALRTQILYDPEAYNLPKHFD